MIRQWFLKGSSCLAAVVVHVHQVSFDRLQGNSMCYRCYVAVGFHMLPLFSAHLNSVPGVCEGFLLLCSSFLGCEACVGSIFSCIGLGLEARISCFFFPGQVLQFGGGGL